MGRISKERRRAELLALLVEYQDAHGGATPSPKTMAKRLGITSHSVRYALHTMASAGLIRITSQHPWRIEVVTKPQTPLPLTPPADTRSAKAVATTGGKREGSFVKRAQRIASFVDEYIRKYGNSPMQKEVAAGLGYKGASPVSRDSRAMVQRGWLHHMDRHHGDYIISALGREVLLAEHPVEEPQPVAEAAPVEPGGVETEEAPTPLGWRVEGWEPEPSGPTDGILRFPEVADAMATPTTSAISDEALVFEMFKRGMLTPTPSRP